MNHLKHYRTRMKLSQKAIAGALRITQQAYSKLEIKGIKTLMTAKRCAKFFNCKPEDLMKYN